MDRKVFFRSLASQGQGSDGKSLGRKTFFQSVTLGEKRSSAGDDVESGCVPVEPRKPICFTLSKLRDFKAHQMKTKSYVKEKKLRMKRPNYNNSKRRLLSKPIVRVKYFGQVSAWFSVCYRLCVSEGRIA